MSGEEAKDPSIKLFGTTILPLPTPASQSGGPGNGDVREEDETVGRDTGHEEEEEEDDDDDDDDDGGGDYEEALSDVKASSGAKQEEESRVVASKDVSSSNTTAGASSKTDEEQSTSNLPEKVLKKPDKILPCPRCNSMDTKFCYYNNYNMNQPRHFCKNCQRYWTAGGTMRNVPVGAGRRKNKSTSMASNCRHITVPEALHIQNGFHHPPELKTNGTILTFGAADSRLCESMVSVLNIAENSLSCCTQNGFHRAEELIISESCGNGEKGADISSAPEAGASQPNHKREKPVMKEGSVLNPLAFPPQMPCFTGPPLGYPVSPPALVPQVIPMPFYPGTAYWSIPWVPQPPQPPPPWTTSSCPNSPTLGKHSRDENTGKPENSEKEVTSSAEGNVEKCLWVPKTLRVDDPREAAKSSIWAALGIKNERADPANAGGPFKAFQQAGEARRWVAETSAFLKANPAALSRSLNFHENA
ncbi:hypothetical protein MLD38_022532 [Melastoma candidum]|uniref:Uncharacterized protein n=1 Tax=Melastoma candidum TaxID=119954 RepID=A0ACB9QJK0_9MYRT|nr:hypothetical protein MLD38_022532 [Melastoma candidum]